MAGDLLKCPWCGAGLIGEHLRTEKFYGWSCGSYDACGSYRYQTKECHIRQLEAQVEQLTKELNAWKHSNAVNSDRLLKAQGYTLHEGETMKAPRKSHGTKAVPDELKVAADTMNAASDEIFKNTYMKCSCGWRGQVKDTCSGSCPKCGQADNLEGGL